MNIFDKTVNNYLAQYIVKEKTEDGYVEDEEMEKDEDLEEESEEESGEVDEDTDK